MNCQVEAGLVLILTALILFPLGSACSRLWRKHRLGKQARNPGEYNYYLRLYRKALQFKWWHSVLPLVGVIGLALMTAWWRSA